MGLSNQKGSRPSCMSPTNVQKRQNFNNDLRIDFIRYSGFNGGPSPSINDWPTTSNGWWNQFLLPAIMLNTAKKGRHGSWKMALLPISLRLCELLLISTIYKGFLDLRSLQISTQLRISALAGDGRFLPHGLMRISPSSW